VCISTDTVFSCSPQRVIVGAGEQVAVDVFVSGVFNLADYTATLSVSTSPGSGGATIGCPSGVQINLGRSDYVFFGSANIIPSANCATGLVGTRLLSGGVNVTGSPGYLGTFLVDVDAATADGSVFSVAFSPSQSALRDANGASIPFSIASACTIIVGQCSEVTYGDVDDNGVINLFDVLCILKRFQGSTDGCRLVQADIAPCGGDGVVDVLDVMATLDELSTGAAACPNPCVPPLSITSP